MEDIISLSYGEHKILHTYKSQLESRHKVKILMPDLNETDLCVSGETIIVTIIGDRQNIGFVQRFINRKLQFMNTEEKEDDQSVIILTSDSEEDSNEETVLSQNKTYKPRLKKRRLDIPIIDLDSTVVNQAPVCEVTSTTNADESVILIEIPAAEEFIPVCINNKNKPPSSSKSSPQVDSDIVVICLDDEDAVDHAEQFQNIPKSISTDPIRLRPIVIDGSNVARLHGKPQNTFSCKGIKICVDYFLRRGHPQVTAFVPLFRKHCRKGAILTTDQHILEELEKTQHVVFTPSRRIDGKAYSCYDDRFIVELAASNGGVILSNDNYKDLLDESPAFAQTIKNRLLMFCFVGDMLMIPSDPLGSNGPKLQEYLSFPPVCDSNS